jgi:hypothetical protein
MTACASTAGIHSPASGEPMRVTLTMYGAGQKFELVNPAHTDPVKLYSRARRAPNLKVADDQALLDIIDYLGAQGFNEHERVGKAPAGGAYTLAFEIETPGGVSHWGTNQKVSPQEELVAMNQCVRYFVNEKYNQFEAFQTIENADGGGYFDGEDSPEGHER